MHTPQILLVDDDRLTLSTLAMGLRDAGYRVAEASSGAEALACVADNEQEFDLAIADINMPNMSGIELAELLARDHDIHTLFLSAYSERELVDAAIAKGAMGYLVKPLDVARLIPQVESALARINDFKAMSKIHQQLEKAVGSGRKTSICVGILMERQGLSESNAFNALRSQARASQTRVEDLATEIVEALEIVNAAGR